MSRPLRLEYPGAWYHVMNGGRRKEKIFLSRHDYEAFIQVLREALDSWNLQVSAYCLMANYYHLLVHTPDGNISRCMRHINGVYTQRFNREHQMEGQLFRGRYKAVLVDADSHLLEVMRYIHRNPLRAGKVKKLKKFSWSSHSEFLKGKKKGWLYKDFLFSMLASKKSKRKSAYIDFISQGESEETERFYSLKNFPSVMGSDSFKESIKEKFQHLRFSGEIAGVRELAPSPEKIIELVCDHFKVAREQVAISRRGTENIPRDVAIYLVRHHSMETLANIGLYFGISNYSTVSSAVHRVKLRLKRDGVLRRQIKRFNKKFVKG